MLLQALKICPKSNKFPNLVTPIVSIIYVPAHNAKQDLLVQPGHLLRDLQGRQGHDAVLGAGLEWARKKAKLLNRAGDRSLLLFFS